MRKKRRNWERIGYAEKIHLNKVGLNDSLSLFSIIKLRKTMLDARPDLVCSRRVHFSPEKTGRFREREQRAKRVIHSLLSSPAPFSSTRAPATYYAKTSTHKRKIHLWVNIFNYDYAASFECALSSFVGMVGRLMNVTLRPQKIFVFVEFNSF